MWLSLTNDVLLRSYNWARLQLGIPLPSDEPVSKLEHRRERAE